MLLDDLNRDLREAMKARDTVRLDALRMALAAAKEKRIELRRDLEDGDLFAVLQTQVKRRQDSIEQYRNAGRAELAAKEEKEMEILSAYLPTGLSEAELEAAVDAAIAETGASSKRDIGKVMKALMAKFKGQVDGKAANRIAGQKLA